LVVPDPEGLDPYPAITAVVGVSRSPPPQVRRAHYGVNAVEHSKGSNPVPLYDSEFLDGYLP
jgi:hypothetical protein